MFIKDLLRLFRIQIHVLYRGRFLGLHGNHGFVIAEPRAARRCEHHVGHPALLYFLKKRVHDLPGTGGNPTRSHMDGDLHAVVAISQGDSPFHRFFDPFEVLHSQLTHFSRLHRWQNLCLGHLYRYF